MEVNLGSSPSWAWRSLLGARPLIENGLVRQIGDGRGVRVWHDPWLVEGQNRFLTSERLSGFDSYLVVDLIDEYNDRIRPVDCRCQFSQSLTHEPRLKSDV